MSLKGYTATFRGAPRLGPLPILHHESLSTSCPGHLFTHLPHHNPFPSFLLAKLTSPAMAVDLRMRTQDMTKFHSPTTFLKMKPEQRSEKEVGVGQGDRQKQEEQTRQQKHHICVSESAVRAEVLAPGDLNPGPPPTLGVSWSLLGLSCG